MKCKFCNNEKIVKNGFTSSKNRRFKCQNCKKTWTGRDQRKRTEKSFFKCKLALILLLYGIGGCSIRFIASIFRNSPTTILYLLRNFANSIPEPSISNGIKGVQFDEMWHYLKKNLKNCRLSKQWTALQVAQLHGLRVVVILEHSKNSTKS